MKAKKSYKMTDLDCANCAAKMETAIRKIQGVEGVSISFMTQRLSLEAEETAFEEIMRQVVRVCKKIEPGCTIAF